MLTFTKISELQEIISSQKNLGNVIGLVPTMGNLHDGHLKLVKEAKCNCDFVICTIFVNPLQFGANEDLEDYPRTIQSDISSLELCNCDCLFHPETHEIYPDEIESQTIVSVPELGANHCGQSRPGHFDGVTTVVAKLFNICQPERAFFGLKDYQQYLIIERMKRDLRYPIEIVGVETQREASGLALSSRNNYLTNEQKDRASLLQKSLVSVSEQLLSGNKEFEALEKSAIHSLKAADIETDYFSICNSTTLLPARQDDLKLVILGAVFIGKTRLIDNILIELG